MPASAELPADEVHVWVASLDVPDRELAALWGTLSAGERERAGRLRFDHDRRRFVARRGLRREILGAYVGRPAAGLDFRSPRSGKPELAGGEVHFNCSHSQELALCAVSRERRLGVDVERLRRVAGAVAIADSLFTAAERTALLALPAGERDAAFLRCWTRKEACLKAGGEGLGGALDTFTVSLAPASDPPALEAVADPRAGRPEWSLQALVPTPCYVAAVATVRPPSRTRCRRW